MDKEKVELSKNEQFWIAIKRINDITGIDKIYKKWVIGRLTIVFEWRSKKNLWGRFGGGWNWKLGLQIGSTTTIISLLIFELRFCWNKK